MRNSKTTKTDVHKDNAWEKKKMSQENSDKYL